MTEVAMHNLIFPWKLLGLMLLSGESGHKNNSACFPGLYDKWKKSILGSI